MKKLAKRTAVSLILVGIFILGFAAYVARFLISGASWVAFPVNSHVYSNGELAAGRVVDRNGELLAYTTSGGYRAFSDDYYTRRATLHVVGDAQGNIGTGLLNSFDNELMGYNVVSGVYSVSGRGNTLTTTIDASLCETALDALGYNNGAVVVFNYETGEIICMVSSPGFDPNDPPDLGDDESGSRYDGAYINRGLSSTFAPGSIFKIVTAWAALEQLDDIEDTFYYHCTGSYEIGYDTITCTSAHGDVDFGDALGKSCNGAFAQLALMLGGNTLESYAARAGLLDSFKVDDIRVPAGHFEPAETSDLAWSGIGQYTDLVNPLAMARFMGAIANGGAVVDPRLVDSVKTPAGLPAGLYGAGAKHRYLSAESAETLKQMMRYNVTQYYDDGRFYGLELGAKSGTAEVADGKSPHAWFVGFLDDPENPLAFAVIVENGGWGLSVAGAVAGEVLQAAVN